MISSTTENKKILKSTKLSHVADMLVRTDVKACGIQNANVVVH